MKKFLTLLILPLMFVSFFPISVSAETSAGIGPSSFFYFFDTIFEKVDLFFTFDSEQKIRKSIGYADERLAEAKEATKENKPKAVSRAMEDYKKEISFAIAKSKELKDKKKTEELLNIISRNTIRDKEALKNVLNKIPSKTKEVIPETTKVKKEKQKEDSRIVVTPKNKTTVIKNRTEKISTNTSDKQIEQLKKEIEELKQKAKQPKIEKKKEISKKKADEPKIATLPNGAIVEMNKNGDIIKTIKNAPIKNYEVIQQKQTIQTTPVKSNLPSTQALQTTLTKMARQQCYDVYQTRAQIQTNINKAISSQILKMRERQELLAKQKKEIANIRNATDSYSVSRRIAGNEESYINFKKELQQQRLASFDANWDLLHLIIRPTNLSRSREEMCNF